MEIEGGEVEHRERSILNSMHWLLFECLFEKSDNLPLRLRMNANHFSYTKVVPNPTDKGESSPTKNLDNFPRREKKREQTNTFQNSDLE